jgi:hypothetical protein
LGGRFGVGGEPLCRCDRRRLGGRDGGKATLPQPLDLTSALGRRLVQRGGVDQIKQSEFGVQKREARWWRWWRWVVVEVMVAVVGGGGGDGGGGGWWWWRRKKKVDDQKRKKRM